MTANLTALTALTPLITKMRTIKKSASIYLIFANGSELLSESLSLFAQLSGKEQYQKRILGK